MNELAFEDIAKERTRKMKLYCSRLLTGLGCMDPACDRDHENPDELNCDSCGYPIDETDLELTGRFGDIPLHTRCAIRRYGEGR